MTTDAITVEGAVLHAVRETVAEVNPTCHATVTLDSSLDRDLGLDSLVRAELLIRIEDALHVRLGDRVVSEAETPRDLVDAAEHAQVRAPVRLPRLEREQASITALPTDVRTLVEALDWHASAHSDRVHVRLLGDDRETPEATLTYGTLRERASAIASGLAAMDVRPGDAVAIMLATSLDYFAAFIGVLIAGAVPVPLYPPARPAHLDDYLRRQTGILDNAEAVALVTSPEAQRMARVLRSSVASLRRVVTVEELERAQSREVRPPVRADSVALLQYTSGSTGSPKGVVLTHADLLANIRAMAAAADADSNDVFVSWLPLYHDMGLIGAWLGSLCIGFPLVVMSPLSFLARPARWLQAMSDHRATLSASPNFGFELCARNVRDEEIEDLALASVRMLFNGAEPVSAETLERFVERFVPVGLRREALAPVYGLAEAAVGLAFPPPNRGPVVDRISRESLARRGIATVAPPDATDVVRVVSCGRALPGYEIRIVDRAGGVLADRHEGRVEFRGLSATQGYFRNAEETRRLYDGDWLDTGDLGYLARGDIYLTGRAKDLIIRAGRNVHPEELEAFVGDLAGVRRGCVAVFSTPDPEAGTERLVVAAETRLDDADARQALLHAIENVTVDVLGVPCDEIVLLPPRTIPKTSSGKIRRAACRDRYEHGTLTHPQRLPRVALARLALRASTGFLRDVRHAAAGTMYALYAWTVTLALAVPTATALVLLPRRAWRWAVLRRMLRLLAHLVGISLTTTGVENLRATDGAIVVANHASWIDGAVLASMLPGAPVFVVAGELAEHAWSGLLLRRLGAEFVHRASHEQGAADTRRLISLARAGNTLVAFPEGRLSYVPGVRAFRVGAFLTAVDARVPIVPVALRGTRSLLAPGHRLPRRASIAVDVAEQTYADSPGWAGAVQLQRGARTWILERCDEPDIA